MGARQSKGGPGSPGSPRGRRRGLLLLLPSSSSSSSSSSSRERGGDFLASLVMRSGEKFGGGKGVGGGGPGLPPPYHRRVGLIQELLGLAKEGRHEEATDLLKHLRQDLGMESTSLDDVLYRYASFRNLVDPITHDLIISLARYIHCPRPEGDSLGALEKLCRQLTYHLSPHSQWRRQGSLVKKKPQACLKTLLVENPQDHTVDLSGIPLTPKDLDRVIAYLQQSAPAIESVELCFTELTDELFLQLLPVLGALPRLSTLSLNGNRLTKAILRDLTDSLKDPRNFPSITWIDLGNNVDIFSLPQPFLVSLKKRCPTLGNLPTILEFGEGQASDLEDPPARGQEEGRHCGLGGHRPGGALEESLVPGIPGAGTEETKGSCRLPLT